MKLLIEDYPYPADKVRGLLGGEEPYGTDGICRISNYCCPIKLFEVSKN